MVRNDEIYFAGIGRKSRSDCLQKGRWASRQIKRGGEISTIQDIIQMFVYFQNKENKKGISSLLSQNMADRDFLKKINKLKEEEGGSKTPA